MRCPLCESQAFSRDYASSRAYAILLFGVLLLVVSRQLLPAFMPIFLLVGGEQEAAKVFAGIVQFKKVIHNLFGFGLAAVLLGIIDIWRDEAKFCLKCGFRGRFPRKRYDLNTAQAISRFNTTLRSKKIKKCRIVGWKQSVAPLIKMLNSRDEKMRIDALQTLRELTGEDLGNDAGVWQEWWEQNKDVEKKQNK